MIINGAWLVHRRSLITKQSKDIHIPEFAVFYPTGSRKMHPFSFLVQPYVFWYVFENHNSKQHISRKYNAICK